MNETLGSPPIDSPAAKRPPHPKLLQIMGPGLITGASDDDPSGIATYSQVGAQFGYGIGWTLIFSYPLMCAIQQISGVTGRVTGEGLAGNLRRHFPKWLMYSLVALLLVANTINIGADIGAMAAALKLLIDAPTVLYIAGFAVLSVLLETFVRYARYVTVLKWLTLSLFAYVATAFVVDVPWPAMVRQLVWPHIEFTSAYVTAVVAILGTTISPYLFFWQAEQEVEQTREDRVKPLLEAPEAGPAEIERIRLDTYLGMGFSNLIALFIVITTAATLHAAGQTDIQTSAQAAEALRPIAGRFAFTVFALGIIGTGLLALPVLAGSAAYAMGEAFGWRVGLGNKLGRARAFYGVIALATLVGALLNFVGLDPIKALFWSAVINGVAAVPIMAMMVILARRADIMGRFRIGVTLTVFAWIATAAMALAAIGMFATWGG